VGEAAIASPLQLALGMEQGVFVKPHLALRMLIAEDATAFATVVTAVEESKRSLAGGSGADGRGTVRLYVMSARCGGRRQE
jgi:hypothetical protein